MLINFLNYNEARLEYRSSDYLKQFDHTELKIRLGLLSNNAFAQQAIQQNSTEKMRNILLNIYCEACRDFTTMESEIVTFYVQQINQQIRTNSGNGFFLPNQFIINFIKIDSYNNSLDWGYPYTINDTIILPTNYLEKMLQSYQIFVNSTQSTLMPSNGPKALKGNYDLLLPHLTDIYHEIIHVLQRNPKLSGIYGRLFNHIYQKIWGFIPIKKEQLFNLKDGNYISNPDGYNFQWLISIYNYKLKKNCLFLPTLVYDFNINQPIGILIEVESLRDDKYQLTNRWDIIDRFPNYINKFYGLTSQLYHPNEILAHLLSDYLILGKIYSNHQDYFYFYDYINKYLLKPTNLN